MMNNLQAQREGESDRAFFAYKIYRDLGESRSYIAAYRIYIGNSCLPDSEKGGRITAGFSEAFRQWSRNFDWEARAKDWDNQKAEILQASLIEIDKDGYIQRIEASRQQLEDTATMGMNAANLALSLGIAELQELEKEAAAAVDGLPKKAIERLMLLTKIAKDSIEILSTAKTELFDALGLLQVVNKLENDHH